MENILKNQFNNLPNKEFSNGDKPIREFFTMATALGVNAFDEKVIDQYMKDCNFVENKIIDLIANLFDINIDTPYISRYNHKLSVNIICRGKDSIIIADQLFIYTMVSFFMTIFSLSNDRSEDNYKRCIKNCIVLLDLQGLKNVIGTFDHNELNKIAIMPDNVIHLAMDTFWTSWTFVYAHELFHIINNKIMEPLEEEKEADAFGYKILMKLIEAQKLNKVPRELRVYHEYLYISPVMLMEYYKLLDYYKSLLGIKGELDVHPAPTIRQEYLFDLFDSHVPDSIDTRIGNEIYKIFLDTIDLVKEELLLMKKFGKLHEINIENIENF